MKKRVVLSLNVAAQLVRMGHKIIERKPNIRNPEWDVFVFERTPQFDKDFNEVVNR